MDTNILFTIGDYSCDGHSFYAEFIVKANKPLQELREIHFKENEFFSTLCSECDDNQVYLHKLLDFVAKYMPDEELGKKWILSYIEKKRHCSSG